MHQITFYYVEYLSLKTKKYKIIPTGNKIKNIICVHTI